MRDSIVIDMQYAEGEKLALEESGGAFIKPEATDEYLKMSMQAQNYQNDLTVLAKKHEELIAKQNEVGTSGATAMKKISDSAKKSTNRIGKMTGMIKNMLLSMVVFQIAFKGIDTLISIIGKIIDILNLLWTNVLQPLIEWIVQNILPVLSPVISTVGKLVHGIVNFITDLVGTLAKAVDDALQIIIDLLNGDFSAAWESAKNLVKDIANGLISCVESLANGVVDAVNTMINALNGMKFTAPDWVPSIGGKSFSLNIPNVKKVSIPRLANGGITTGETIAKIGDNPGGKEAVLPLSSNTGWMDTLASKIAEQMPAGSGVEVIVQPDPQGIFKVVRNEANNYYRRTGNPAFEY